MPRPALLLAQADPVLLSVLHKSDRMERHMEL